MFNETKTASPYRLAEIAIDKLHRKNNLLYLHALLTMDCLLIDECTQINAQQFAIVDIILRHIRHNSLRESDSDYMFSSI